MVNWVCKISCSLLLILLGLSCANHASTHSVLPPEVLADHLRRAEEYLSCGKLDSAKALFAEVEEDSSDNLQALNGLAKVALHEEKWAEALKTAKRAMKLDHDDCLSRYIAAVAEREMGKELLSGNIHWHSSWEYFNWILERDSSFEDVLYEYALLERYRDRRDHALELTRVQLVKRPDLASAQLGLYTIYRYFMAVEDSAEFVGFLRKEPGLWPKYFIGEFLRRHGNLSVAESLLTSLVESPGEVPSQAIRLSLTRLYFARGEKAKAEAEYWRALRDLHTELGAAIVFEDLKYILSDGELAQYRRLNSLKAKEDFFQNFWNFRNPSLALGMNLRLQEHIRRYLVAEKEFEYYGFRTQFNNPDRLHELTFPKVAALNEEFNDMGLVYLRHGEPDDVLRVAPSLFDVADQLYDPIQRARTRLPPPASSKKESLDTEKEYEERLAESMRLSSFRLDPGEAWLYNPRGESPKKIFYFQKHNSSGNNWRLSPGPASDELVEELIPWDVSYERLLDSRKLSRVAAEAKVKEESKVAVDLALSTEEQTWKGKTPVFGFPHAIDVFRAPDGRSLLDISYAIPIAALTRGLPDSVRTLPVEVGVSLIDAHSQRAGIRIDTLMIGLSGQRTGGIIDLVRYTVQPDSYAVSMHLRPLTEDLLGTWREVLRVRDFSGSDLMVSSIQLLRPSTNRGAIVLHGVRVAQSPLKVHLRSEPLYIYFQVYNLIPDGLGNTSFRTECVLLPEGEADEENGKVIYRNEKTGREETIAEFYKIDVQSMDPGRYELIVKVTDRKRVQTVMAQREIEIVK
jgi:tetratricopeptide (TPR) repeat protein